MQKKRFFLKPVIFSLFFGLAIAKSGVTGYAEEWAEGHVNLIQEGYIGEDTLKEEDGTGTGQVKQYLGNENVEGAKQAIYQGISTFRTTVDLSGYNIPVSMIGDIYQSVINANPQFFYVSSGYSYSYQGSYVYSITLTYLYSGEELRQLKAAYEEEVARIMAGIQNGWSDLEKAMYVHDYFCSHYEYDETYSKYSAVNLFTERTAVCNGYYLAYRQIMNLLGIENDEAQSDSMNHIWNQIKINGNWYNVDVTWGDPVSDIIGRATHGNFLKSDTAYVNNYEHYDWDSNHTCDSTYYDNAFWNNIKEPFAYADGNWYCISDRQLFRCDINSQSRLGSGIEDLGYWYTESGTGWWTDAYSGLASYGNLIYFNTSKQIKSYDPESGESNIVMRGTGTLYGFYLEDNVIHYGYASGPNNKIEESGTYELPLAAVLSTGVTLDQTELTLMAGGIARLTATVSPENVDDSSVTWRSTNEDVAVVDGRGTVTAIAPGSTDIVVITNDTGKTATCHVTVKVKAGWQSDEGGWYYQYEDGSIVIGAWKKIGSKWYHFDDEGYMQTGWYKEGSKYYYLKSNGQMAVSEWVDNGKYYVDANGVWDKTKKKEGGTWKKDSKGWWYQNADGTYPKSAWKKIDGKWYHFDKNGYMQTGWYKEGNYYYYLKANGVMAADEWVGKYYIDANGHWVEGMTQ